MSVNSLSHGDQITSQLYLYTLGQVTDKQTFEGESAPHTGGVLKELDLNSIMAVMSLFSTEVVSIGLEVQSEAVILQFLYAEVVIWCVRAVRAKFRVRSTLNNSPT